ncbi:MAG: alanine racemase [Alphaproteobacteria bacterium]|nr:alanine racemase [Alphaproteobacteria bacterium]
MEPLTAADLADLVGGVLEGDGAVVGRRLVTDSRAGVREGDLFLGLRGVHFDGRAYAAAALDEGASVAVVGLETPVQAGPGKAIVRVEDGLEALRAIARACRRRLKGTVVGITGSNGKTIVKDMLTAALAQRSVSASPMSWNSAVGVPLALVHADPDAAVVLVECGISEPGEMQQHAALVEPDLGVFVNVGDAHLEGLGSREVTAREKAKLFAGCAAVFVPADQALARAALQGVAPEVPVDVPAGAGFLAVDAALARAVASHLGVSSAEADAGLATWRPAPMRLEISTTPHGVVLVNDAYTSDPESVEGALAVLMRERSPGRAIAVLGGMAQLGSAAASGAERVGRSLVAHRVDSLIAVGPGGAVIARAARAAGMHDVTEVSGVVDAAAALQQVVRPGDRVLLKGSRPDRLERLVAVFFDALAPAVLTVDLDAIVGNFRRIQQAVAPADVMPMVKAFGYGVGDVRVALALQHAGAAHFAVAYPDEGIQLRERGVVRPILVQNTVPDEAEKLVTHGLSAQVSTVAQVAVLAAEAARQRRTTRVHLKVDTGMGRAGCAPEEALGLARAVLDTEWLVLDGLMTHFSAADDPAADDFTRTQIARFEVARGALAAAGIRPRWTHASNSAGIARFPEATYDLVRTGLALFGYSDVEERRALEQHPALTLTTRVVSVKTVGPGEPVGYGRSFHTGDAPQRIAVVALGYGDGYPWSLSNRGSMRVGAHRVPVVGRVCMDVTMLDVTGVPEVQPGDPVVVFGPGPDDPKLPELAALAGTIPYELLTRLSPRIRRVFESSL